MADGVVYGGTPQMPKRAGPTAAADAASKLGVSRVQIEAVKDAVSGRKLSKLFCPPVSLSGCRNVEEIRERLLLAWKKENGEMRSLQALGDLMTSLKKDDRSNRRHMSQLFSDLQEIIEQMDEQLHSHLEAEAFTRGYKERLKDFKQSLQMEACPVVVVGQVSSGKSSLLNLFLGEDYLPSQMLSCTASVCELTYADVPTAQLLFPDGRQEEIAFTEREQFIFKRQEEREDKFQHEAVQLALPVPFLKSGIVLIDTPGIGENVAMESVLVDYVETRDVFGFLFVIKCNDSGGVLQRFKNLIRKLSEIQDRHGSRKLDPKSVLFVANFWDQVPSEEQEKTKDQIISTLHKEQCLSGFNPQTQLFFMNTKFALSTWKEGLISEDYDKLISGIQTFFPIGHKRKLEIAYLWYERLLDKILHPIRVYLATAKKSKRELAKEHKQLQKEIDQLEKKIKLTSSHAVNMCKAKSGEVQAELMRYLASDDAHDEANKWKSADIYKEEEGDTWVIIEQNLECNLEEKVSSMLQNWENERQLCHAATTEIVSTCKKAFNAQFANLRSIDKRLGSSEEPDFEMDSWHFDTSKDNCREQEAAQPQEMELQKDELQPPFAANIDWTKLQPQRDPGAMGSFVSKSNILKRLMGGPKMVVTNHEPAYRRNKVELMQQRTLDALTHMLMGMDGNNAIDKLIQQQFQHVHYFISQKVEDLREHIHSNRELLKRTKKHKMNVATVENVYQPLETKGSNLHEKSITFRLQHLLLFDFQDGSLKTCHSHSIYPAGLFGDIIQVELVLPNAPRKLVTGKKYKQFITVKDGEAYLKYGDIFFHVYNLSMLQAAQKTFIPRLLGLAKQGPCLVFEGHLQTASMAFSSLSMPGGLINKDDFISQLGQGLEFLHDRKVVNLDICLDSILVNEAGSPILANPYYPCKVPFPTDLSQKLDNYLYMAPEVFPYSRDRPSPSALGLVLRGNRDSMRSASSKEDGSYTSAADVYALSLVAIELLIDAAIFKAFKQQSILHFMERRDPAKDLQAVVSERRKKTNVNELKLQLCINCLRIKRSDRKNMKEWNEQWQRADA